jgi:hypothetical protein
MTYSNSSLFELEYFPKLPWVGFGSKIIEGSGRIIPFAYSRVLDDFITKKSKSTSYFEFHSAPLLERHSNLLSRSIFHIHGSEVRRINEHGQIENATSEFTRYALQNAPLVFYSTPELIEVIGKYTKRAVWMPHITNLKELSSSSLRANYRTFDLVFPSSFEIWKGSEKVLDIIKRARQSIPNLKIAGIDLGSQKELARQLGINLYSVSIQKKYHRLLNSADVAIGQGFGLIGAADIESVQLGLRFFPISSNLYYDSAYGFEPSDFTPKDEVSSMFVSHITDKDRRYSGFENKVLAAHDPKSIITRMWNAYNDYLS